MRLTLVSATLLWLAVSAVVSPLLGLWIARRGRPQHAADPPQAVPVVTSTGVPEEEKVNVR